MVLRLKISHKLAIVGLLFLLPVAFTMWEIIQDQQVEIRFATQEIAGARYLAAIAPIQGRLEQAMLGAAPLLPATSASLAEAETAYGATLASVAEADAAVATLRDAHDPASIAAARAKLRQLIVRVGDKSNLILDNVLETYYVVDVILNRLPDLMDRVADLPALRDAQRATKDADGRARFLIALGGFGATLDAMRDSMKAAEANNPDGTFAAALHADYERLDSTAAGFAAALQKPGSVPVDPAALVVATQRFAVDAAEVLRDRLMQRVDAQHAHRRTSLAMASLLFIAAITVILFLARMTVVTPLTRLTETTNRLARGDLAAPVPELRGEDELAQLCRALAVFKQALIKNGAMEREREQENAAARARLEAMQALSRDFNLTVSGKLSTVGEAVGWLSTMPQQLGQTAIRAKVSASEAETTVRSARNAAQSAAAAAEELANAGREIGGHLQTALSATRDAADQAQQARDLVRELSEVVQGTSDVLQLMNGDAGQSGPPVTNSSAEIEQAANATAAIAARIATVRASADRASKLVSEILDRISQVEASSGSIATVITNQSDATAKICRDVQTSVDMLIALSKTIKVVRADAGETETTAEGLHTMAYSLSAEIEALRSDVTEFVRANMPNTERRANKRYEADLPVTLMAPTGIPMRGKLRDISLDGAAVVTGARFPVGASILLGGMIEEAVECRVIACSNGLVRLQFRHDADTQKTVRAYVTERFVVPFEAKAKAEAEPTTQPTPTPAQAA